MLLLVIKNSPFIHYLSCTVSCFYRKSVQLFIICVNCIAGRRIWEYNSSILRTAEVSMNREEYEISIEELKRVDKNTCTVIDIRDEISYNYGNIPNSVNIPLEKIKNDKSISIISNIFSTIGVLACSFFFSNFDEIVSPNKINNINIIETCDRILRLAKG